MNFEEKKAFEGCKKYYDDLNECLNRDHKNNKPGFIMESCEQNYINLGKCTSSYFRKIK
jgi:hypothetical protein